MRLPDQDHSRRRHDPHQPAEGAERFGDSFVRFKESEDADERLELVEPEAIPKGAAVRLRNPRAVRNHRDWSRESRLPDLCFHELGVNDHPTRPLQQSSRHRQPFVVRPDLQFAHPLCERPRLRTAVVFAFADVSVPIPTLYRDIGDQVMQVRFV